jgi:glycine/D-amino acid oxidase-like deaminating enzyme
MNRRTFLEICGGIVLAGTPSMRAAGERIVVAGGGIIGASIAYQLVRRGASVTLVEKARPAAGATSKSFAWINATFSKQPWNYFHLNRLGIAAWRQLADDLQGALTVTWGGSIEWCSDAKQAEQLRKDVRGHQEWGYATSLVDKARLETLEPNVMFGPVTAAAWSEEEGHVDPVRAVEVLLARAQRFGARVEHPVEITGLDVRNGRLRAVRTTRGDIEADVLVIACGTDTPKLAAMAGINVPLKDSPGVLVHTAPQSKQIERVVLAPVAHMKQKADGSIVAGEGFGGSPTTDISVEAAAAFLRRAAAALPSLGGAQVKDVTLGFRPLPKDDYPAIGFAPGRRDVYVSVMHSGVTLSQLVGRLAATEILDSVDVDMLQSYRPARFAN